MPKHTITIMLSLIFFTISFGERFSILEGEQPMHQKPDDIHSTQDGLIIFASYAETDEQLLHTYYLAESIRKFAGRFRNAPIWIYIPDDLFKPDITLKKKLAKLGVQIKTSRAPDDARQFYYAGKVFAAAKAEEAAEGKKAILVWLDEDTIILQEPGDFELDDGIAFAYCPVMHNRSGSLYSKPPDSFWSRIYEKLSIDESSLFPMVTPADKQTIRAYFNAGLLVVKPECRILRDWVESFIVLYRDSVLADMCSKDINKKIFLHQTALVGAVMKQLGEEDMIELSEQHNYPIFFHQQYDAEEEFDSIEDIVTLRYDVYFRNPDPEWSNKLKGPEHVISWLKERLGREK